jgi:hypothetical protein
METIQKIIPYLLGGIGGAFITMLFNMWKTRIQKMECHYINEDVMSKLPITAEEGITHSNIYTKQFLVINTTNIDHKEFRLLFEFDSSAKILKHTNISKSGANKYKSRLLKENEYSVAIKNLNRKDQVKFVFEIANISDNYVNITEDNCIGFKIILKDKRASKVPSKLTFVSKEIINATIC